MVTFIKNNRFYSFSHISKANAPHSSFVSLFCLQALIGIKWDQNYIFFNLCAKCGGGSIMLWGCFSQCTELKCRKILEDDLRLQWRFTGLSGLVKVQIQTRFKSDWAGDDKKKVSLKSKTNLFHTFQNWFNLFWGEKQSESNVSFLKQKSRRSLGFYLNS